MLNKISDSGKLKENWLKKVYLFPFSTEAHSALLVANKAEPFSVTLSKWPFEYLLVYLNKSPVKIRNDGVKDWDVCKYCLN